MGQADDTKLRNKVAESCPIDGLDKAAWVLADRFDISYQTALGVLTEVFQAIDPETHFPNRSSGKIVGSS